MPGVTPDNIVGWQRLPCHLPPVTSVAPLPVASSFQVVKARDQGALVSWAHFPFPEGELAIDVALGKIDAVELIVWTDPFDEDQPVPATRTYYRLLNTGAKLAVLRGTDKMLNTQVVGSVRTYVQVDGDFSYAAWLEGIRAGRTFATTGPMLTLHAGDHMLGDTIVAESGDIIEVRADLNSREPVNRIEIIQDGDVVATYDNASRQRQISFDARVTVKESSWIVARAYSDEVLPYQTWDFLGAYGIPLLAHTSPIYIQVDGKPASSHEDATYFLAWCDRAIEWARTKARVHSREQRWEMIALYEKARTFYLQQVQDEGIR